MKVYAAAVLGFAGLVFADPFSTPEARDVQTSQSVEKRNVNAEVDGFRFDWGGGGCKLYLPGTKAYWMGYLTEVADVDLVFQPLRIFLSQCAQRFNAITQNTTGVCASTTSFKAPKPKEIKLIINSVNNWSDYGGIPAYNAYFGTNTTAWYTDPRVPAQYQKYVEAVVGRYRNSSAVFAWELANEPRCHGCDPSVFTTWATATSAYITSLDPTHMITTGEEGFMNGGGDEAMSTPLERGAKPILSPSETNGDHQPWSNLHNSVGKPCILEEYGGNSNLTLLLTWQTIALNTYGIAGDLFWQYGDTISYGETPQDGNTIYYNTSAYEQVVTEHIERIDTTYYEPIDR